MNGDHDRMIRRFSVLHWVLVLLAWCAQLGLPVVHAATMAPGVAAATLWCGSAPASADLPSDLPPDLRAALDHGRSMADVVDDCRQLCAGAGGAAPLWPATVPIALATPSPASVPRRVAAVFPDFSGRFPPARGPPASR